MAYATYAQFAALKEGNVAADQTLIETLIARAQALIDAFTGRTFEAAQDATRYFTVGRDTDGPRLWLDRDLCAITSVTNGDADVLATTEYTTEPKGDTPYRTIKLLASSGLAWTYTDDPEDAVVVVGKWAYATTAPTAIQHATLRLALWLYEQRHAQGDFGAAQVSADGVMLLPSRLPRDVAEILSPYRKRL